MVIPAASNRARVLALGLLAATFVVGGLSGMALQQTRAAASPSDPDAGVLMVPFGSDGELRACPAPRPRVEPLDSIGASREQQDSIGTIYEKWHPKLRAVFREYDQVQDSLFAGFEVRSDAVRDSMQRETRAVLTAAQRTALEAFYARRDSTYRAMRKAQDEFERECRAARRADSDRDGNKDDQSPPEGRR